MSSCRNSVGCSQCGLSISMGGEPLRFSLTIFFKDRVDHFTLDSITYGTDMVPPSTLLSTMPISVQGSNQNINARLTYRTNDLEKECW